MTDLQFNNDQADEFGRPPVVNQGSDFTGKLVRWGLASNRQQAEYVLLGIAVVAVLFAGYMLFVRGGSEAPDPYKSSYNPEIGD